MDQSCLLKVQTVKKRFSQFPGAQSDVLNHIFCPTNSPKPRDSSFTIRNGKQTQQAFTFKNLDPEMLIFLPVTEAIHLLSKYLATNLTFD